MPAASSRKTLVHALRSAAAVALAALLVVRGYGNGSAALFYSGLLLMAVVTGPLAFWLGRGRWHDGVLLAGLCVAIACVLFIGAEIVSRALKGGLGEANVEKIYAYREARANRKGFVSFWDRHIGMLTNAPYVMADPHGVNPYVLRPGGRGTMHESQVRINQLGFRGREISVDKGDVFRIVALGESTTFGVTIEPTDRPWPEVLEERIRRELACDAPVEVVNGGVPGWNLVNQLNRMDYDILPLHPDLILSYHGYNGFQWLFANLPGLPFLPIPQVPPRPSSLLERAEKAWRLWDLRRRYEEGLEPSVLHTDVFETSYAECYRRLVDIAREHGIELVLATFNMAVNERSPEDVVEFYAETFPDVRSAIVANQLHSRLLLGMPKPPGVHVIDTAPGIDGEYEDLFVDLVHFTQAGRDRLAGNLLVGLRDILMTHPRLHCRPVEPTSTASGSGAEETGSTPGT